jgi:hypothetical protein
LAHIAAFNLSNHKIQMPLLIPWPTADVGAVWKNRQAAFGRGISWIAWFSSTFLEPCGNSAQSVTHRGVMGRVAGKKAFHQPRGFAKGMPGLKLGMEPLQLRGSPVWKEIGQRRNRSVGHRR